MFLHYCNHCGAEGTKKQLRMENPKLFCRKNYSDTVSEPSPEALESEEEAPLSLLPLEEPESEEEVSLPPLEEPESEEEESLLPLEEPVSGVEVSLPLPEEPVSGVEVLSLPLSEEPLSGAGVSGAGGVVGVGLGSSLP